MSFRLSIPLPGPFSWSPSRRRRARRPGTAPSVVAANVQRSAEAVARGAGAAASAMDASAARMDGRRAAQRARHAERMAELRARRALPWRHWLRASFGLRP